MTTTITKKKLVDRITQQTGHKRAAVQETVQLLLEQMIEELGKGNRVEFRDFGVFEVCERAPRVAQNPRTLEPVHVPARKTVRFKVGRLMRLSVQDSIMDAPVPQVHAGGGNGVASSLEVGSPRVAEPSHNGHIKSI